MLLTDYIHRVALCTLSTKVKIDEFVECTSSNVVAVIVLYTIHGIAYVCVCAYTFMRWVGGGCWGCIIIHTCIIITVHVCTMSCV